MKVIFYAIFLGFSSLAFSLDTNSAGSKQENQSANSLKQRAQEIEKFLAMKLDLTNSITDIRTKVPNADIDSGASSNIEKIQEEIKKISSQVSLHQSDMENPYLDPKIKIKIMGEIYGFEI